MLRKYKDMELLSNLEKKKPKIIFNADTFDVLDINGINKIQQKSKLLILPYFVEQSNILLRYESVETFNIDRPEIDKFVQICECTIENDINETLKQCLSDKFGLILNDNAKKDILNPIFLHKDNTTKIYVCILPLMEYMYDQQIPKEDKNNNIIININEINNVIIYDLITKHVLDTFKTFYSLF